MCVGKSKRISKSVGLGVETWNIGTLTWKTRKLVGMMDRKKKDRLEATF